MPSLVTGKIGSCVVHRRFAFHNRDYRVLFGRLGGCSIHVVRELGAHQPFAFQASTLKADCRYFVSFEVSPTCCLCAAHVCVTCGHVSHAQGIENGLDRVGSFVTPALAPASREVRVLSIGRDCPPRAMPSPFPKYNDVHAAEVHRRASILSGFASLSPIVGAVLVTVRHARNLTNKDTFKVWFCCISPQSLFDSRALSWAVTGCPWLSCAFRNKIRM